jgi:hypothetical protein
MYQQVDKTKENKIRSAANFVVCSKNNAKQCFGFIDNRSATAFQRRFNKGESCSPYINYHSPFQLEAWSTGAIDGQQTQVDWKTSSLGGDIVGDEMNAKSLGPDHLQGGPPKSSSQKKLMNLLPTDPHLSNKNKYIRGHLLNDNLGGPGTPNNLFPITANANKEHESIIESKVKQWVNNEKQWVTYNVKVRRGKVDLANGIVNSVFACTASVWDPKTNTEIDRISANINSEISVEHQNDRAYAIGTGKLAYVGLQASVHQVLLSTSKKIHVMLDEETLGHLEFLFSLPDAAAVLKKLLMEYEGIGSGTAEALSKFQAETTLDKKTMMALTRVTNNIGDNGMFEIISDVYDEIF